ncbi:MAG: hypothetical protein E6765_13860, partial [Enterococcus faecalis]|nr:hypothetical protein [Enterococcus faecalis]
IGSTGMAKVEVNSYTKNGEQKQNNRIKEFLKPAANSNAVQQANQQTGQQPQGTFQPGAF